MAEAPKIIREVRVEASEFGPATTWKLVEIPYHGGTAEIIAEVELRGIRRDILIGSVREMHTANPLVGIRNPIGVHALGVIVRLIQPDSMGANSTEEAQG